MEARGRKTIKSCVIKDLFQPFKLDNKILCNIMDRMNNAINQGLSEETHKQAAVKCYPTYVRELPTGNESGKFIAIDLGGSNFRVSLITLGPQKSHNTEFRTYIFPEEKMTGEAEPFFDYLADRLQAFLGEMKVEDEELPLGFVFSFPIHQTSLDTGVLARWTKRFQVSGVVGKDVMQLFKTALNKLKLKVIPKAIVSDTTGCLLSCAWKDNRCRIGVIIGTGTNACYLEKIENVKTFKGDKTKPYMVINTEWGNFGTDGTLNDIATEFDKAVEKNSNHQAAQLFEKMISGWYSCEILRSAIIKCTELKYLFDGVLPETLKTKGSIEPENIYAILGDDPIEMPRTSQFLRGIGASNYTRQDSANVRYMCKIIIRRSVDLLAAAIGTLVNRMQITPITIGIDGGLYRFSPKYREMLNEKLRCMVSPDIQIAIMLSEEGSGRGAALATLLG